MHNHDYVTDIRGKKYSTENNTPYYVGVWFILAFVVNIENEVYKIPTSCRNQERYDEIKHIENLWLRYQAEFVPKIILGIRKINNFTPPI